MAGPTLKQIADAAGVGTATVERVLNGRGGVRDTKVEAVILAAKALGYARQLPEKHRGSVRIEVMLVRPETSFYTRMHEAFQRMAVGLDRSILLHRTFVPEHDPAALEKAILKPGFHRSALIIAAPDHPKVRAALRSLAEQGTPVVQVVSEAEPSLPYVGIDNVAAGRTAALFMTRMLPRGAGRVLATCHSGAYAVHRQRIAGFSQGLIDRDGPELAQVLFTQDDDGLTRRRLTAALREDQTIVGLYTAGGGNSAVADVLRNTGRDLMWIGHDLTDRSRGLLRSGQLDLVFDQAPETQARRALDRVFYALGLLKTEVSDAPVRFYTITQDNI